MDERETSPIMPHLEWEEEKPNDWFHAFWMVLKTSLTDPTTFFIHVREGRGILRPWLYAFILSFLAMFMTIAWQLGFHISSLGLMSRFASRFDISLPSFPTEVYSLTIPISGALAPFVTAALIHLFLMIVGGAKRTYIDTFRVVCYSSLPSVFGAIPLGGSVIAWIWMTVLHIIGIKEVHETTTGKSVMAVFLLPMLICCLFLGVIGMIVAIVG